MRRILISILALAANVSTTWAAGDHWVTTWAAAPLPPSSAMGPFPATPSFDHQTILQTVRISAGGERLRLRLSNEYGAGPLSIGAVRVSRVAPDGKPDLGSSRIIAFDGHKSVTVPPGAPLVSDPVDFKTSDLESLAISLYIAAPSGPCTCHATGLQPAFVSKAGDFTNKHFVPSRTIQSRAFIAAVETGSDRPAKTIVVLGDSISDGIGSTLGANRRWPDILAERLAARGDDIDWGVANEGISGNRVLGDGAGQSALARFDRDVLSTPGIAYVIVFEGINDIGISYGHFQGPMADLRKQRMPQGPVTAEQLILGYRQLIDRAHSKGIKVFGATITPYEGAMYYAAKGEKVREKVNDWIRTSSAFDAVLDFDAAIRDPEHPTQVARGMHMGDHLHGSDAGYKAIADSIDLSLFK